MPLDPNEKTLFELVEFYVVRHGRVDGMTKMAADLCAYERDLQAAEARIADLEARFIDKTSAGFMRRDVSSHYEAGWSPKKPLPDAVDDEWISTGREVA